MLGTQDQNSSVTVAPEVVAAADAAPDDAAADAAPDDAAAEDELAAPDVLGAAPFCDVDEEAHAASSVTNTITIVNNDNVRLGIGLLLAGAPCTPFHNCSLFRHNQR
jgi:cytochrome c1